MIDGGRGHAPTHQAFEYAIYIFTLFGASIPIPSGGFRGICCCFSATVYGGYLSSLEVTAQGLPYQTSDLEN